jgi:putative zinc finger protein
MTMPWTHVDRMVAEYCDGCLSADAAARVDAHLRGCARCRKAVDDFRFVASAMGRLPIVPAPDSVWPAIEAQLPTGKLDRESLSARFSGKDSRSVFLAAAAMVVLAIGAATLWYSTRRPAESWEVSRGATRGVVDRVSAGEWLQTGTSSRMRITVGSIGFVDVEPNSRVRLGATRDSEHRIELARGEISAQITAPPRLFFVDTPASTVVDLGCAYTMKVGEAGDGRLRVTLGWASLEWNGRAALVPAGASCRTRPGAGPGTPCFDDASQALQQAIDAFDFQSGGRQALDTVLTEARVRDTLTLWHLLSRVDAAERGRVADRITSLTPLPAGVSRDKALQLDPDTLKRWREELAWTW